MSTKKDKFSIKDKLYMELALDLAKSREGHTGPNPSVGCVIVKDDKIISIGQTSLNGRPHAEYNAIKNCYEDVQGSKMYVTLEPCCHQGITSPCTSVIIKSKISEVIYSVNDVDRRVKGKSKKILNSKKIIVKTGLLKDKIKEFYNSYFYNRKYELPFVTGKIAISKNNLIYSKGNKRITNYLSDNFTHLLRYKNDSIMVSCKTLNKDDSKLNCRLKNVKNFSPRRIILDNKLNLNTQSFLFKSIKKNNTIVFYNEANRSKIKEFKKNKIILIKSKLSKDKKFDMKVIFKKIYALGTRNILIEGGNELTTHLINKRLFNKFYLFKSKKILSKLVEYKEFTALKDLKKNYKNRLNLKLNFGKDAITLYKN
ncbi:bifunctional diaminohydroxyphosphoribosylaminopyrimidine deaminase/5-amino-6-(5-phosphoribosylamino)uracil reductase RibD [Candidatus Pelagibacter bacterium nBUS_29]|uniref:bifunctional diaminohydroxyphosphoribosylaminopyrimidine deaminase/5-amino-6-(5-phosphoribosylamino)uracil reductase RibD n=1 Tax=Candidatus Pelagibacter bacterium nBUS_29 TaxID=3374190 RepID=UPI003EBB5AF7